MNFFAFRAKPPAESQQSLEDFFAKVRAVNPFIVDRAERTAEINPADQLDDIHRSAFDRLVALSKEALSFRRGLGVVLWGDAGVGKSHLLARLERWGATGSAVVVTLPLMADPERMPFALLQGVMHQLTRGRTTAVHAPTPLYDLTHAGVLAAVGGPARFPSWTVLERSFEAYVEKQAAARGAVSDPFERTVCEVLFRFFRSASRARAGKENGAVAALAVRWLAGQSLSAAEAEALELGAGRRPGETVAVTDSGQVRQVLAAITRFAAAAGKAFVISIDDTEGLTPEQVASLTTFLSGLLDAASNLLVITAGLQPALLAWHEDGLASNAAWDRIAQFTVALRPLTIGVAEELVAARMRPILAPFANAEPIAARLRQDPLFPLGRSWRDRSLGSRLDVRPRDLFRLAREGWRREQESLARSGGAEWLANWGQADAADEPTIAQDVVQKAVDLAVREAYDAHWAWLARDPQELRPDADRQAHLLESLLLQCVDAGPGYNLTGVERFASPRRHVRSTYDLILLHPGTGSRPGRTGVLFLTTLDPATATRCLRALAVDFRPPDRVFLISDERIGMPLGAGGQRYLTELRERTEVPFHLKRLTFDEHAAMDSIHAVVRLARTESLEAEPQPGVRRLVTGPEVIESHHRAGRYLACPLIRELLVG